MLYDISRLQSALKERTNEDNLILPCGDVIKLGIMTSIVTISLTQLVVVVELDGKRDAMYIATFSEEVCKAIEDVLRKKIHELDTLKSTQTHV